ncbi:hypothetical protein [Fuchsiella alkaliacetigena]|uniref:hypothetical protein n=1 Tax=Fuchsiella alkaliacetigena TaxID=957042 RepID=UPI00200AA150|nr:hypothetical protein [Fuchsiella alkaliacetigena]MCK8823663.1 hypothetical protein [Fuchsiella alkaliacetigena]
MKLVKGEVYTTTDILKELFDMHERLIYNITEQERYNHIYKYLVKCCYQGSAYPEGKIEINGQDFYAFCLEGARYVIPELFLDKQHQLEIPNRREKSCVL